MAHRTSHKAPKDRKTLVITPTYNEAENISSFLRELMEIRPRVDVLIVDDNSPDGTAQIVRRFARHEEHVHLLLRQAKEGLAAAYLAGFQWAMDKGYDNIIQMDADFSHKPSDLPRLIEGLSHHDCVMGARYVEGGATSGWSWMRKVISRGGNTYARTMLSLPYQDLTGGFVAWRREVLQKISLPTMRCRGYAFQVELKCRTHRAGFKILEVPIHFENRKLGRSKMSGFIFWEAAYRVLEMRRTPA